MSCCLFCTAQWIFNSIVTKWVDHLISKSALGLWCAQNCENDYSSKTSGLSGMILLVFCLSVLHRLNSTMFLRPCAYPFLNVAKSSKQNCMNETHSHHILECGLTLKAQKVFSLSTDVLKQCACNSSSSQYWDRLSSLDSWKLASSDRQW